MPSSLVRRARRCVATLVLLAPAACADAPTGTDAGELIAALSRGSVVELEVGPARVPCTGVGPMECLQVRTGPDAPWELFYDAIEGFAYEPGYLWRLRVARRAVADPPADGSSIALRLLAVLSKVPA